MKQIESWAFGNCTSLEKVSLGNGVQYIGGSAFENAAITSLVIPDSVETIESYAFSDCSKLQEVTGGLGLIRVGNNAFGSTPFFEEYVPLDGVIYLGNVIIRADVNGHFVVREGVVGIGATAFQGANITGITLPEIGEFGSA